MTRCLSPRSRAAAVYLLTLGVGPAFAQSELDRQIAALEASKNQFLQDKNAAKQKVLDQFDVLIKKIAVNPRIKAADRLSWADKLKSERQEFDRREDLPDNSDVVAAAWLYGTDLVRKYKPLSRKFDDVMNACLAAGIPDKAEEIKAAKQTFDDEYLPGRGHLTAGAEWRGSSRHGTDAVMVRFRLAEVRGSVFKARAELNYQVPGHPVFEVGGSLDGIHVRVTSMTNIQGRTRMTACAGFVVGRTLILRYTAVSPKGIPKEHLAVLRKS